MSEQHKTLKQWQKIHPDAIQIKSKSTGAYLSNAQLLTIVFGPNSGGKVLQHDCSCTWSKRNGSTFKVNAIVSKLAGSAAAPQSHNELQSPI